eukprot:c12605_g1_i2.p1 GENE.c12605_g1_i2~~c12605_g1_i2.p1  ORF type:complete len:328 (+),score=71.87 c12605_g1_i2:78-986(+)
MSQTEAQDLVHEKLDNPVVVSTLKRRASQELHQERNVKRIETSNCHDKEGVLHETQKAEQHQESKGNSSPKLFPNTNSNDGSDLPASLQYLAGEPIGPALNPDCSLDLGLAIAVIHSNARKHNNIELKELNLKPEHDAFAELSISCKAGTIENLQVVLQSPASRIVHLSSHCHGKLLLQTDDNDSGEAKLVSAQDFYEMLRTANDPSHIQCIVLATCNSQSFSDSIHSAGVTCAIVTIQRTHDLFVKEFVKTFYKNISDKTSMFTNKISLKIIQAAFDSATASANGDIIAAFFHLSTNTNGN